MKASEALEETFEELRKHEEEKRKEYGENGWEEMSCFYWWDSIYRRSKTIKNGFPKHPDFKKPALEEILKIILEACFLYQKVSEWKEVKNNG